MQLSDVTQLVKLLDKSSLTEISFSDENSKVVLKKEAQPGAMVTGSVVAAPPAPYPFPVPSTPALPVAPAEKPASKFKDVTSPMVGTFYASSTPGGVALTQVGTAVKP